MGIALPVVDRRAMMIVQGAERSDLEEAAPAAARVECALGELGARTEIVVHLWIPLVAVIRVTGARRFQWTWRGRSPPMCRSGVDRHVNDVSRGFTARRFSFLASTMEKQGPAVVRNGLGGHPVDAQLTELSGKHMLALVRLHSHSQTLVG